MHGNAWFDSHLASRRGTAVTVGPSIPNKSCLVQHGYIFRHSSHLDAVSCQRSTFSKWYPEMAALTQCHHYHPRVRIVHTALPRSAVSFFVHCIHAMPGLTGQHEKREQSQDMLMTYNRCRLSSRVTFLPRPVNVVAEDYETRGVLNNQRYVNGLGDSDLYFADRQSHELH